jgi:hypothetical protein
MRTAISFWLSVWSDTGAENENMLQVRLRALWSRTWRNLESAEPKGIWSKAKGPVAALILGLKRLGFRCDKADAWSSFDNQGELIHSFEASGASRMLLDGVMFHIDGNNSASISRHWSGKGAERGADFSQIREMRLRLLKAEEHKAAGQLLCIGTGATWPNARKLECKLPWDYGGLCLRCGSRFRETDIHR